MGMNLMVFGVFELIFLTRIYTEGHGFYLKSFDRIDRIKCDG